MAHRCWEIDEIVTAITESLVRDGKRASAVALASCSKSLVESALGVVWRTLYSFAALVGCFSSEVWEFRDSEQKLFVKRAPLEAEWVRFQRRYASKVRHLKECFGYGKDYSAAFHPLYSSDGPLLPNLISLVWFSNGKNLPLSLLFFSPSLVSVTIHVPSNASPIVPPILDRLYKFSPNILEIDITGFGGLYHDTSREEASSQLLMHCNHRLRKFRIDSPISASALRHVIQLPSLQELRLVANSVQLPDPLPTLLFPSLRKLFVECSGDFTWLNLLPAIGNPVLTGITVMCPGSEVEGFMETFQKTMTGCGMHKSLQELDVRSSDQLRITPRIIASNVSFKSLTSLTLSYECSGYCQTSDLTDHDIDLLTEAMPCLKVLKLGGILPCAVPSRITFKSLYNVSRRCTSLTDLLIHFNPSLFVTKIVTESESWDVALGISDVKTLSSDMCRVKIIFIGNIPLPPESNASSVLALGLLGVFPCLRFIQHNGHWGDVAELVKTHRLLGCSAFGKG